MTMKPIRDGQNKL